MIEEYQFGEIIINGKKYTHDIEIRVRKNPSQKYEFEVLDWWRKEGHIIDIDDIKQCLEINPQIIIIGTGAYGVAKITQELKEFLEKKKIKLISDHTGEAVKTFNILLERKEEEIGAMVGFFHLTC